MTLIPPAIVFLVGLCVWFVPRVGAGWRGAHHPIRPPRRIIQGKRKQVISGLLMFVSVVVLVFQLNPGYPIIAWIILWAIGYVLSEPVLTPEEEYKRREEEAIRQSRPLPVPDTLPSKLRAQLTKVAEQSPLKFDTRFDPRYGKKKKAEWEICNTLFRMRLVSREETGPGESWEIFTITEAGQKALEGKSPKAPSA